MRPLRNASSVPVIGGKKKTPRETKVEMRFTGKEGQTYS